MRIFSGVFKGRRLQTTTGPGLRPAMGKVREALFSMLDAQGIAWDQTAILDLFAGSGSLGFEALSRGAKHVTFVEKADYAAKVIAKNAATLEIEERVRVEQADALLFTKKPFLQEYSLIFIDPPYELKSLKNCVNNIMQYGKPKLHTIINAEVDSRQKFDASSLHTDLELITDRFYGQTRVLLWRTLLP